MDGIANTPPFPLMEISIHFFIESFPYLCVNTLNQEFILHDYAAAIIFNSPFNEDFSDPFPHILADVPKYAYFFFEGMPKKRSEKIIGHNRLVMRAVTKILFTDS